MDEAHALKNAETVRSRRLSRQGLGPGVVALGGDQIVLEPTWKALPFPS